MYRTAASRARALKVHPYSFLQVYPFILLPEDSGTIWSDSVILHNTKNIYRSGFKFLLLVIGDDDDTVITSLGYNKSIHWFRL